MRDFMYAHVFVRLSHTHTNGGALRVFQRLKESEVDEEKFRSASYVMKF